MAEKKERPNLIRRIGRTIYQKIDRHEQKSRSEAGITGPEKDDYKTKRRKTGGKNG